MYVKYSVDLLRKMDGSCLKCFHFEIAVSCILPKEPEMVVWVEFFALINIYHHLVLCFLS